MNTDGPDAISILARDRHDAAFTLVEIMIVVAIIGLLAAIAVPNFIRARTTTQRTVCMKNLQSLDFAKQEWALENGKAETDTPDLTDLFSVKRGYLKKLPVCPAGGTYSFNEVGAKPTCSRGDALGHTY